MKQRSDIDRVLRVWMGDGPTAIPDRVVDVVAARIGVQQQRRAWLFRRRTIVTSLKLVAGLAAALVVAVIGFNLLPRGPSVGGPTTAPSPTAGPTSTPDASGPAPLPEGTLNAGTYRLRPLEFARNLNVDAIIPAGWIGGPPCCVEGPGGANGPAGIFLAFTAADGIFSDPCHWDVDGSGPGQPGDIEVGPSVDDLATALAVNPAYEATTPTDVTIGGFPGKRVDLELPSDDCDTLEGENVNFVFGGRAGVYAQGGVNRWRLSIVDVDGTRLIAVLLSYEDTPAANLSAGQAIVDSLVIMP